MPNYDNSTIYKLVCRDTDLIYIGSTTKKLNYRVKEHTSSYKSFINGKNNYTTSYRIIENNNYYYEIIEDFSCFNKRQLDSRERYWIELYKKDFGDLVVNKYIPTRSKKEWYFEGSDRKNLGRNKIIVRYVARIRSKLLQRKLRKKLLYKVGKNRNGRYKVLIRYVERVKNRLRQRKKYQSTKEQNKS